MPYRVDVRNAPADAFDRLVDLGAIDVATVDGHVAGIMPDGVASTDVARALGVADVRVTSVRGRDDGSIWWLEARATQIGQVRIVPANSPPETGVVRLIDGPAFGTGHHPTTILCLEALVEELTAATPAAVLDVGTGSGVLALAALTSGVPRAVAVDIDALAVRVAADNAALNGLSSRLHVARSGPEALRGTWPLVLANILSAPLIEMAPTLVRRVGRGGRLVLSGIRASLGSDVNRAYQRLGMRCIRTRERDGWIALTMVASW